MGWEEVGYVHQSGCWTDVGMFRVSKLSSHQKRADKFKQSPPRLPG
jgi:hypothetical protein